MHNWQSKVNEELVSTVKNNQGDFFIPMISLGELVVDTKIADTRNSESNGNKRRLIEKFSTVKLGDMALAGKDSPNNLSNHNIKAEIEIK